ncbi:MAG: VWA domain-containing protein [Sandaracinaceae bacterium]
MGYGSYSHEAHRALTRERQSLPQQRLFAQRECHPLMNPMGIAMRESRDSPAHPQSRAVVLALDVTGSMGQLADQLARRELPKLMERLSELDIGDPQVLFMAVGDAVGDRAPLQVGQFESTAELMDQWLTWTWLEGGGGQGGFESYELALFFAARHVSMDCVEKRRRRGYLFLTGDEKPYPRLSRYIVQQLLGTELESDPPIAAIVDEVQRLFEPFFLIPDLERRRGCERVWRDVLGDRVVAMESPDDLCDVIAGLIALTEGRSDLDAVVRGMRERGVAPERASAVARSLIPYAASLERDGAPRPSGPLLAPVPPEITG